MQLDKEKKSILINIILGIFLYIAFYFLDLAVYPVYATQLLLIRIVFTVWSFICIYILIIIPKERMLVLAIIYLIPAAFGISLMCYVVGEGFASIYFVGNFLVLIGASAFTRIKRHSYSLLLAAIFTQHLFVQSLLPFAYKDLLITVFFLGSSVILSIFIYASIRGYEEVLLKPQEELYLAATTDPLTSLLNRRKMIDLIERESIRSARNDKGYVLVIADIDNFKNVNDTYGHDSGDAVLVSVANCMKTSLRAQDLIGRWGGEEFIIILPDTNLQKGTLAIERLRLHINKTSIKMSTGTINITMTFGIAASDQASTMDALIKLADGALYKGKRGTKNCVIAADTIQIAGNHSCLERVYS